MIRTETETEVVMKTCMLAYAFYENDTRIRQYVNALQERGDEVDVVALRRRGQPRYENLEGVNVYRIQTRVVNESGPISYFWRIFRFMAKATLFLARKQITQRYSLIHVHSVPDVLVFAALIPKLLGAAVILDIHDPLPELFSSKFHLANRSVMFKVLLLAEKFSIAFSNHVIIANHIWRRRLVQRSAPERKVTAICNYPDPRWFSPKPRPHRDKRFIVVYPGTLNRHQGVDTAIKAIARVKASIPQIEFHIYGEGPAKAALIALVSRLQLRDTVAFHDFLPTEVIAEMMASCDLGIEPKSASSQFGDEALSTKILEFMRLRIPVIASRTTTHQYYYPDSTVMYFESDNDSELSECILKLYESPQLRQQLVSRAALILPENSWEVKKHDYLGIVNHLVGNCHTITADAVSPSNAH